MRHALILSICSRAEVVALPSYNSSDCVTFGSFSPDCYLMFIDVCCDTAYMATVGNRTDIVVSHNVVSGVPIGSEISAAEAYFNEFKATAVPPSKSGLCNNGCLCWICL